MPAGGAVLLPVTLTVAADAPRWRRRRATCVLTQGTRTRRIPYWAHVERPRLATASARLLTHPGIVRGSTRGQPNRVHRYRYPAYTGALGLPVRWRGGEALYRFHLAKRAINAGVTVEPISRRRPAAVRAARASTRTASPASRACRSTSARR